jgi:hypothetical protein
VLESAGITEIAIVSSNSPSSVITVISAPGIAMASTTPFSFTVNLLISLDSQNTTVWVASIGSISTDNCNVSPTFITWLPPAIDTPVTCITLGKHPLKKNIITKKVIINLHNFLMLIFVFLSPLKIVY